MRASIEEDRTGADANAVEARGGSRRDGASNAARNDARMRRVTDVHRMRRHHATSAVVVIIRRLCRGRRDMRARQTCARRALSVRTHSRASHAQTAQRTHSARVHVRTKRLVRTCMRTFAFACVRACGCLNVYARDMRACVHACVRACVRACLGACSRAHMTCVFVRAPLACVRVQPCACASTRVEQTKSTQGQKRAPRCSLRVSHCGPKAATAQRHAHTHSTHA
jgi:hypothetical protein